MLQKRSLHEELLGDLQRTHAVALILASWSQRVQVVPDSHLCVLHTPWVGGVAFSVKNQLVNTLGLQTIWFLLQLLRSAIMAESSWGFT